MANTRARFQRGSGCFNCTVCGRKTRSTGRGDNEHVRQCEECYEMGGIENLFEDGRETPELRAEYEELKARCIAKGGKL